MNQTRPLAPRPRLVLALTLAILVLSLTPLGVFAQDNRDASIGLYLKERGGRVRCADIQPLSCADPEAYSSGELYVEYVAYLCVFNADATLGVSGVECSLRYDDGTRSGVDIDTWTMCADLEWPQDEWPYRSGEGNRVVWVKETNCRREEPAGIGTGVTAVAGFFFLTAYGDDKLQAAPWRSTSSGTVPASHIADCNGNATYEIAPENHGYVAFSEDGSVKGKIPCTQRVQEKTTWGTVKELFRDSR